MDNPELDLILAHNNAILSSTGSKMRKLLNNKDIPLFLQNDKEINIARVFQDIEIQNLEVLDDWKMNLMVVSEQHQKLILAVEASLYVYNFDWKMK